MMVTISFLYGSFAPQQCRYYLKVPERRRKIVICKEADWKILVPVSDAMSDTCELKRAGR